MADTNKAIMFVLRQEDSTLSGICTNSLGDRGGRTRFGIASRWHPDLVRAGFYETDRDHALEVAQSVYAAEYASFLHLPSVRSQPIANALLSFSILENAARAALEMQEALNSLGARVVTDGSIGPETLRAINAQFPTKLLDAYVDQNRAYLHAITERDPSQRQWLRGWMNRCDAVAAQSFELVH
jgi:type VI secretion system secreted protein VgrG